MEISFFKYQATKNDFVVIDNRSEKFVIQKEIIQKICDRKRGVGSDGLILLQESSGSDFRMRIFNNDGSEAESCGNGLLCLGRLIEDLGFSKKRYSIELKEETVFIELLEKGPSVLLNPPKKMALHQQCTLNGETLFFHLLNTGVPHAVFFADETKIDHFENWAKKIRDRFNANVNIIEQKQQKYYVRTFERGLEKESEGCGTGSCAAAVALHMIHKIESPISLHFKGGILHLHLHVEDQKIEKICMTGMPCFIFSGKIFI